MSRYLTGELVRLQAVDGETQSADLPEWASSLVITNALDAVVYLAWRRSPDAAPGSYDVIVPGAAYLVVPVPSDPGVQYVTATVDYPGAVPAADAGLFAIVTACEAAFPPTVGALA